MFCVQGNNKINKPWYDTVYLCINKTSNITKTLGTYKCYTFYNYTDANNYIQNKKTNVKPNINSNMNSNETKYQIIPVCKWIPYFLHKKFLNYKLNNSFFNDTVTIYRVRKIKK
jgi:hypothetical protein